MKRAPGNLQNQFDEEKVKALENELERLALENNRLVMEQKDLFDEAENMRKKFAAFNQTPKMEQIKQPVGHATETPQLSLLNISRGHQIQNLSQAAIELRYSYSFRLGQILLNAVCRPGKNTLRMPYFLVQLAWDMISGRGRRKVKNELERSSW